MKKLCLALIAIIGTLSTASSQYATIQYDIEKNYFNEGQPLPAEKTLMFTGLVPDGVDIIEISILPAKANNDKDRLYLASWKDFDSQDNTNYSLAVNYRLRASSNYDFRMDFYRQLDSKAQAALTEQIIDQVKAYLNANIIIKGNQVATSKGEKKMVAELNEIIDGALQHYRSQDDTGFAGLSATVRRQLENMDQMGFGNAPKDSDAQQVQNDRQAAVASGVADLQQVIVTEIRDLMAKPWSKLSISRYVDNYETEQKKGFFSLSVGYGGVHLNGQLEDLTYGASPYLGLAFPLSNSTIAPKFLRNSSVIMGAFLENFEDDNGNQISGLIVDRPIYLGLDYKLFEFIRFNAGAAFLEKTETITSGIDVITDKETLIRPFVGLSARIDLSIRLGR